MLDATDVGLHEAIPARPCAHALACDQRLLEVLKNAAEGSGCATAHLYLGDMFAPSMVFDAAGSSHAPPPLGFMASTCLAPGAPTVIQDVWSEPAFHPAAAGLLSGPHQRLRFLAASPVRAQSGEVRGALVVADGTPRTELKGAQDCILQAHAAQLALLLDLQALQAELDLTRSAHAASSHVERLRLLESVVVHANDAVLIAEAEPLCLQDSRIVYCNAAFTRATGYTEAEALGRTPSILYSPRTDPEGLARLHAARERWEPVEVELLIARKDGTEFFAEVSNVPVADENGWFTHWVSVQRDVSDRRLAEETRLRARAAEAEKRALEAEIEERRRVESKLMYAAFHDDLTKLRNRAFFMDRLDIAIDQARRDPAFSMAVLFMDIDRFKLVNDSLGHCAGDLLLIELAGRMRSCVRPQDTLARIGGDEFALLIEGVDDGLLVTRLAERLIDAVAQPMWLGAQEVSPSCSVGVVHATGQYGRAEELLRDADIAMYRSKRSAAGGCTVFSSEMSAGAVDMLEPDHDLRHAVVRDEVALDYQPICCANTGRMVALEALPRRPSRDLVAPASFVGGAEQTGLLRDIGPSALSRACAQMRAWLDQHPALELHLGVNVSGVQLKNPGFLRHLSGTLAATGLSPRALQIEITEHAFTAQPDWLGDVLTGLRQLGVRIALDDFGAGHSSLSCLDRYPVDAVKVDRSLVGSMLARPRTLAIMRSVVGLAADLDIDVIAKGVEDEAQSSALRAMGCGLLQGSHVGPPMDPDAVGAALRQQTGLDAAPPG